MANKYTVYWTKERCREAAKKYQTRTEFNRAEIGAYEAARKAGWLDEICIHMKTLWAQKWTDEKCRLEALKYSSKTLFKKQSSGAYAYALKHGLLNEICAHMKPLYQRKVVFVATKEECMLEAQKFQKKSEFLRGAYKYYNFAKKQGWLDEICGHMIKKTEVLTFEECQNVANNYSSRKQFRKENFKVYLYARCHNWLDDICCHMFSKSRSRGFWTKEKCQAEALKYSSRSEFARKAGSAVEAASKHGWMDEICSHMHRKCKPNGFWKDKENCLKAASKCRTKTEFARTYPVAYQNCLSNKWTEAFKNMQEINNYNNSYEECAKVALLCTSQDEMYRKYPSQYGYAYRHGFLKDIFQHVDYPQPLSVELVRKAALHCSLNVEFRTRYPREYSYAQRHHILKDICKHMVKMYDTSKRCIYAFEFPDNYVYVGLTCSLERRIYEHLNSEKSAVYLHIKETNLHPKVVLKHDYTNFVKAKELEGIVLREYIDKNWHALNRTGTGGIGAGGELYSMMKKVISEVKYCENFNQFAERFPVAYDICLSNDWLEYVEPYMGEIKDETFLFKPKGKRSKKIKSLPVPFVERMRGKKIAFRYKDIELIEEAKKYKNRTEFRNHNFPAYSQARSRAMLDSLFPVNSHLVANEQILEEAKKYSSRKEFCGKNNAWYQLAQRRGILDEACFVMPNKGYETERKMLAFNSSKCGKYWTEERIIEEVKKYKTISDFIKFCPGAYGAAMAQNLQKVVHKYLKPKIRRWTEEQLQVEASKYSSKTEFQKNASGAYCAALKRGILDKICLHMVRKRKSWKNIKDIKEEALKYSKKSDFIKFANGAYNAALNLWIVEEICNHMHR